MSIQPDDIETREEWSKRWHLDTGKFAESRGLCNGCGRIIIGGRITIAGEQFWWTPTQPPSPVCAACHG